MSMTPRTVLVAAAAMTCAVTLTACNGSSDEPRAKVAGTATSSPSATTAPGAHSVPGSMDVKRLGAGWSTKSAAGAPAGLYQPCGEKVLPSPAAKKAFAFNAPAGFSVLVENAKYSKDASIARAAVSAALLNCGADDRGGAITTNAILSPIAKLDSAGAHVSTEGGAGRPDRSYWVVAKGNLLVSVLVTASKSGVGAHLPAPVQDAFAARIATAAVAAATGGAYGHLSAPGPNDSVVSPNVPAGSEAGPAPAQDAPAGEPTIDVSGPIAGPSDNQGPSGMDGPAPVDGYMKVDPKIDG